MHKQKIHLTEQEKELFEEAFKDDILSLSLLPKSPPKTTPYKNPFDLIYEDL